jgi:hypothetical protein
MQMGTPPSSSGSMRDVHLNAGLGSYRRLFTDWRIILNMAIVFLSQFRYLTESVLVPYTSVRFGWSIAEVGKPGAIMFNHAHEHLIGVRSHNFCPSYLV